MIIVSVYTEELHSSGRELGRELEIIESTADKPSCVEISNRVMAK